jgi:hypothetical protein
VSKKKKRPAQKFFPKARGKKPAGLERAQNAAASQFQWRVNRLDWDGQWGWEQCSHHSLLKEIIPKLHDYETMTWADVDGKSGSHSVAVKDLIPEAQKRLTEIDTAEDELFSLRLAGECRIWGIRDIAIFRIVWWDPKHEVCPSTKKHT